MVAERRLQVCHLVEIVFEFALQRVVIRSQEVRFHFVFADYAISSKQQKNIEIFIFSKIKFPHFKRCFAAIIFFFLWVVQILHFKNELQDLY